MSDFAVISTWKRKLAVAFAAFPLFVPYRWLAEHSITPAMEPVHRASHVGRWWLYYVVSVYGVCWFMSLLLFYRDGYRRTLTGWLLVPATLFAVPGALFLLLLFIAEVLQ